MFCNHRLQSLNTARESAISLAVFFLISLKGYRLGSPPARRRRAGNPSLSANK